VIACLALPKVYYAWVRGFDTIVVVDENQVEEVSNLLYLSGPFID
jgi:hypothetical protein